MEWTDGFYRDSERGELAGNILGDVAAPFPPEVGERISTREPILARWRLMVRTLKDGPIGHFIRTEPGVLSRMKAVFEGVYRDLSCVEDGPYVFIFNEAYHDGLPMVCFSLAGYNPRLTVWVPSPTGVTGAADQTDAEQTAAGDGIPPSGIAAPEQ